MKVVEIIVTPSGLLTINASGFTGTDCEKATAFLEQALGQLKQKQRKPEFSQRTRVATQQRLGG